MVFLFRSTHWHTRIFSLKNTLYSFFCTCWSRISRLTNFCSSIKKARTIFSRTALWLNTPESKPMIMSWNYHYASRVFLTAIGSEDLLVSERQSFSLSWSGRLDTLQFDTGHGAFWESWPLLQVLENQLASGSADLLPTVWSGVVRQPSSIGDTLNHLKNQNVYFKFEF